MLNNNGNTFDARTGRPKYLEQVPLKVNSFWYKALSGLDDETLAATFSDVLDKRRIKALAKRRDQLMADYSRAQDN
jgi:hypothetical protein